MCINCSHLFKRAIRGGFLAFFLATLCRWDARNMSRSPVFAMEKSILPNSAIWTVLARRFVAPCRSDAIGRAYPNSPRFRSRRRCMRNAKGSREYTTLLEYTTRCIFDLRAFEIWIVLRAHLDFKCRRPRAPGRAAISHSSRAWFSLGRLLHSFSPSYCAIVRRQRGSCRSLPRHVPSISG